jgi:hypothetical protein
MCQASVLEKTGTLTRPAGLRKRKASGDDFSKTEYKSAPKHRANLAVSAQKPLKP